MISGPSFGPTFGTAAVALGRIAARVLGWRPHEFWAATPAELAAILGAEPGEGFSRADLTRMMEQDR
ncbi:MAG: phage tail assembly chaperone [Novosphingobium sp.]